MRLILASSSPRRAELLRAAGFEFEVVAVDVDESVRVGESPVAYVRRLAAEKSAAAQRGTTKGVPYLRSDERPRSGAVTERSDVGHRFNGAEEPIILGADTTVVVGDEILGKPHDDDDVASMLRKLSGRRHRVLTGISLRQAAYEVGRVETTEVTFRELSNDEIEWYLASGEGRDKAGAYAIQGRAARFIPRIEGSYSNVVGLPIAAVVELMRSLLASRQ